MRLSIRGSMRREELPPPLEVPLMELVIPRMILTVMEVVLAIDWRTIHVHLSLWLFMVMTVRPLGVHVSSIDWSSPSTIRGIVHGCWPMNILHAMN